MNPRTYATRVALVDDHPVLCRGLADMLREEGFDVVGTAAKAEDALALLERTPADVVVVDLSLEHGSGLAVLASIRERFAGAKAVVYSVHEDSDRVRRAFVAGAMGYVTKREDPEELVKCLKQVLSGRRFLSPRATRAMADAIAQGPSQEPDEVLSPQEQQVYGLVGRGNDTQSIAVKLNLSARTVETYYGRILTKLNLPGRREMRQHAVAHARRWVEH